METENTNHEATGISPPDRSQEEYVQEQEFSEEEQQHDAVEMEVVGTPTIVQTVVDKYQEQAVSEDAFERRRRRLDALDARLFSVPDVWSRKAQKP